MTFDRNDIKLSFERPQYQTNGREVKCTLKYRIQVPEMNNSEDSWNKDRGYNPQHVQSYAQFELGDYHTATGKAVCTVEDEFDKKTGREIAEARAEAKAYKHAQKLVKKYVKSVVDAYAEMVLAFEAKADYVQRHNAEYSTELGK